MIQELQQQHRVQLQKNIEQTLGFLLNNCDFDKGNLVLSNSYTLWRKLAYHQAVILPCFQFNLVTSNLTFYFQSQCCLLPQFVQKCKQSQKKLTVTITHETKQEDLLAHYNHLLWLHSLYEELLLDITTLPYLYSIFVPNKKYRLKDKFQPNELVQIKEDGQMINKVSQGILKKGFGTIADKMFTKTVLLRASALAIRLNPVAMAASYAFSQLLEYMRKEKKDERIVEQLQKAIELCQKKIKILEEVYEESISLIKGVILGKQDASRQFSQTFFSVIEADWLQVRQFKSSDGWDVTVLSEVQEFPQTL